MSIFGFRVSSFGCQFSVLGFRALHCDVRFRVSGFGWPFSVLGFRALHGDFRF